MSSGTGKRARRLPLSRVAPGLRPGTAALSAEAGSRSDTAMPMGRHSREAGYLKRGKTELTPAERKRALKKARKNTGTSAMGRDGID